MHDRPKFFTLAPALLALLALLLPTSLEAQRHDFDPSSPLWNGLSRFVSQAEQAGFRITSTQTFAWNKALLQTPLLVIGPQNEDLSLLPLKDFIAAGGRVFLADDFGPGRLWFRDFGLDPIREATDPAQLRFFLELFARRSARPPSSTIDLHRTRPWPGQEADLLLRQASSLFLNVPQWIFRITPGPEPLLISEPYSTNFPDGRRQGGVLARVPYGLGTLIVLSDPSLLVNGMLSFGDNRRFVSNLLRSLTAPNQTRKLTLLWGDFTWTGSPQTPVSPAWFSSPLWEFATRLNKALTPLPALAHVFPSRDPSVSKIRLPRSSWPSQNGLLAVILVVLALLVWFVWMWFQSPRLAPTPSYDRKHEEEIRTIHSRFDDLLDTYKQPDASFHWPLILLREEIVMTLIEHFQLRERLSLLDPRESAPQILRWLETQGRDGHLPESFAAQLPALARLFREIPPRQQWTHVSSPSFSAAMLHQIYYDVLSLLRSLGLEERFRQPSHQRRKKKQRPAPSSGSSSSQLP